MRSLLAVALMVALTSSGCLSGDEGASDDGDTMPVDSDGDGFTDSQEESVGSDPNDATSAPTVPDALHFEGTLYAVGECAVVVCQSTTVNECDAETPNCAIHAFTVPSPGWKTTLSLASEPGMATATPDYDLYLYNAAGTLVAEATEPAGTVDTITVALGAGDYEARVQVWNNQDAPYTLDVTFAFA